jgi:hypothetical protein
MIRGFMRLRGGIREILKLLEEEQNLEGRRI